MKKAGEALGVDCRCNGDCMEESKREMCVDGKMYHNFQYFHGGLGIGGNNMFIMRNDGLVPSKDAGWILLVWAINRS